MVDGTSGNDNFPGTGGPDQYNGLGGNDTISGGAGNDTLDGGADNDEIRGGSENDSITGGTGNDSLYGDAGNDTLIGGDGADYFEDYQGANVQSGGEGTDFFQYVGFGAGVDTLSGGVGRDLYRLYFPFDASYAADIVTDFVTGIDGDVIRLDAMGWNLPAGENPFLTGYLRLVQVGANVELQGDQNGGGNSWKTLLILQNATAASFTAANFEPGFTQTGAGEVIIGGDGANSLTGTVNDDTISGGGGADSIDGNAGDDSIDGGSGADSINADYGDDTVIGGTGSDSIFGAQGNDSLVGGEGQDRFYNEEGNDTFVGGEGDDYFEDYTGANSVSGGAGADYFEYVSYGAGADTLTGGAGSDVYRLYFPFSASYIADTVTDFQTGTGGDVIRLDALGLSGLPAGANPFTSGYLRLEQVGANVELQGDQNGGGNSWQTILILTGTSVASFTGVNFDPPFSPIGAGLVINGSDGANGIQGSPDGDTIQGAGGDDTIDGNAGADSIDGGAGNDYVRAEEGNDTVLGGGGADNLGGGEGNDTVDGGIGNDSVYGEGGNDSLVGGDGDDTFANEQGDDTFVGGEGNDYFEDYTGANSVSGGAGSDFFQYMSYGLGRDTITGGTGSDVFNLYYPLAGGDIDDVVTDFQGGAGGDVIGIAQVFPEFIGYTAGQNPFTTGYMRLEQSGADVLLQADRDGGGNAYVTILTLQNTTVAAFTSANFSPAYSPTGTGLTITGSEGANGITGTVDGDTISGLGGNDTISGDAGADSIDGGAGNDSLYGNLGNDTVAGGSGNDRVYGEGGNDSLVGGEGDDSFTNEDGSDTFVGGDGNDYFEDYTGANSVSGGAGEDFFQYVSYQPGVDTLTGGGGSDFYNLYFPLNGTNFAADIITDFQTGAGGDVISIDEFSFSNLPAGANPFTTGHLRLIQVGGNVELQGDQNGGGDLWRTVLVLQNTTVANFTAANFQPAYSPTGTGLTIVGGEGANGITGGLDNDTITGLGGNDTISGSDGNDSIDGGDDNDSLYGNAGNDTVLGSAGNDRLYGEAGNDSLSGGEGDDSFTVEDGNDTFSGGDGNDYLGDYQGANSLSGGAGEDYFEYVSFGAGVDTLTGGPGSDAYNLYFPFSAGYVADIVTDFQAGAGGDVIGIGQLSLTGLAAGANPFTNGYLRLTQSGGNVLLEGDQNGGGNDYRTLLVLQNTTVANFTAANFSPAYSPVGAGLTITGSAGSDGVTGGLDGDTISGLDGNDTLSGSDGNDSVDGGSGADSLYGNNGNDTLVGGAGQDRFYGEAGADSLLGGDGDDTFSYDVGNDTALGGEGEDAFDDYDGANSLSGGGGDDYFAYVSFGSGLDTLTGGTGTDTYNLYNVFSAGYVADVVTDFQGGASGDIIRIDQLGLSGVTATTNLFTAGYLRLVQSGTDTLVQADQNGGGDNYRTVLVLQNIAPGAIVNANFQPNPTGVAGVNQTGGTGPDPLTGTDANDTLIGAGGNDTLTGLGGNDNLQGGADIDSLVGGDGNDALYGGSGGDALAGDRGDDYLQGDEGADTLTGGVGRDTLYGGGENDSLVGDAGNDRLYGQAGNDTLLGGDGDDYFDDNEGANSLSGGAGDDYFEYASAGFGVDTFTGGTGRDTFNVYNPFGNPGFVPDIVTDFATGAGGDVIRVDQIFFTGLGDANPFTGQFLRLVQNGTSVELQGDQNGGGDSWRVLLVLQNTTVANFTAANFQPAYSPTGVGQVIGGSPVNDDLNGSPDGDTITGLDGNDTLQGFGGNDSVDGGAGADSLEGGVGNDTVVGGFGNDRVFGDSGNDSLVGGDGNDTFFNETGNDTVDAGAGNDSLGDFTGTNSLSGGTGEDFFQYVSYGDGVDTLSGGIGRDTFNLYFPFGAGYVADIVTDFATGAGGDVISVDELSFTGLEAGANPFTSNYLRLVQAGSNVELQGDQNGGGDSWRVLLVLQNTTVANFTAANFEPAYSPVGAGQVITGTVLIDTLVGTADGDTLVGLDGNDTLYGNGGNDLLNGGGGADTLYGGFGSDTVVGAAGNDRLYGEQGNDSLSGGEGNDSFTNEDGNDTYDGGAGDDYFEDYTGANSAVGAAGADYFQYVSHGGFVDTLTGGVGSDFVNVYVPFSTGYIADIVTDFQTGIGGDVIGLTQVNFAGLAAGVNPFTAGFLRLNQVGGNVELQGDQDGGGNSWRTILVLQNTTVANFVAANFSPAYGPTGLGETIVGTTLPDSLIGTFDGDNITGLDGNDTIEANAGADTVNAGAGADTVYGEEGADSVEGGAGNDSLYGGAENDTLSGGADNDRLYGEAGNDSLSGGDGQDSFGTEQGNDTFDGGAGDDSLGDYQGANVLIGGGGADYFEYVAYAESVDTLTGGAGSDVFRLYFPFSTGYVADIITDFQTGFGGDVIRLDALNVSGLDAGVNPFTTGYLRLVQNGTSVELQGDQDGGGNNWRVLLVLQNTTVANFTRANFEPGYSPIGVGEVITGTPLVDNLIGTADGDTITGLEGNDTIDANAGADSINAGAGADSVYGELGNDTIDGGDGNDRVFGQEGNDSLSGGEGQDTFTNEVGNDTFRGGGGDDRLGDYQGANLLDGGTGEDYFEYVSYSDQVDTLTGGAGADTFNLYFPFSTGYVADIVTDFTPGADGDEIRLANIGFTNLPAGDNPFLTGHLRLIQSGADTLLQGDQDGGGNNYRTLLVLQNVSASALTGVNFDPAFDPTGVGITFIGTPNADSFAGSVNADSAEGRGDNDTLDGNAGADTLLGEGGNDLLYGDEGNDSIDGGADNDTIFGGADNDTIIGGDGNDSVRGDAGNDNLSTGLGADTVDGGTGNDTILTGDGADRILDYEGANSISSGTGADQFEYVSYGDGVDTLSGGANSDVFVLYSPFGTGFVADIVTDFATGAGGDVIRLSAVNFTNFPAGTNPFSSGHLRLTQVGGNVELQGDQDGGGNNYRTVLVLQNTTVANFTTANFDPAYDPAGVSPPNAVDDAITATENGVTSTTVAALLANDTDPNGDTVTLTAVSATSAAGAVVTLVTAGTPRVEYNPGTQFDYLRAGQTATDTFTYTVSDGNGGTDTATVTVTVNGANDAPTAVADTVAATEDNATTILAATLLANDTDPDSGDTKTLVSVNPQTSAAGASVTINGSGNVVYNPGAIFNGLRAGQTATDSFTYTMRDAAGVVSSAVATVTVQGANDAPTAVADAVGTSENSVATFLASTLLANDTDPDTGDTKAIQSVSATSAQGATVSLNGSGNVVYNPGNIFNGLAEGATATDTFTYTMVDGGGATSSATVTVTITGGNDAPVGVADAVNATEDGATTILAATLLANDTDPDAGDTRTLTVVSATSTQGATVSINGSGNVVYNPGAIFNGLAAGQTATDTFTYTVRDAAGATSSATVTVTIQGANDTPTANADTVAANEDGPTTITPATLLGNDSDPDNGDTKTLQSVSATSTAGAAVSLVSGNVVYNPGTVFNSLRAGQTATDTFTYVMRDAAGATSSATVTMVITGNNDAPTAIADGVTVAEDATTSNLAATLLANDTDPDAGDARTILAVDTTGTLGTVSFNQAAQTLTFTADDPSFDALNVGQTATTTFTYTMRDGSGTTSTATVTVTITGVDNDTTPNNPPDAVNDSATVSEDGASTIAAATLLANDTDPDGNTLTIQSVSATSAQGATVSLNGSGNVVYTPGALFNGLRAGQTATDSFTYTVSDGLGGTDSATVSLTVTGVNDAPVAAADAVAVGEDGASTILAATLLANDTDPDNGDTRTIQSVAATSTAGAAVSLVSGNVVYNPGSLFNSLRAGQTATDSFTYTLVDASGAVSSATVTVTINGANDLPVAVADTATANEDGSATILGATLLANDTDPDTGDTRAIQSVSATSTAGAAVSLSGGNVIYNPGAIFNGLRAGQTATDTFTYTIVDGAGGTSSATVTVTITGANDVPTAAEDAVTASEDAPRTILASLLLGNDTDPDIGDSKAIQSVSATSTQGAAVSLNGSGDVVYNPGSLFNGLRAGQTATDTFTYTMVDGSGATSTATVTVTIDGANDAPTAVADAVTVAEDATTANLVATLLGNDTDPDGGDAKTILSVNTTGTLGTVAFNQGAQTLTFTADDPSFDALAPGETATTTFTYTMRDGSGATSTATVTVTITGVDNDGGGNGAPDAVNDTVTVGEDGASIIAAATLLANDSDPNGDPLTIQAVSATSAQGATVSLNGSGNVVYNPGSLFNGLRAGQTATDSFTYTVSDGLGGTDTATVSVTIVGANDAPSAVADAVAVGEDGASTILAATLLANDTDPDVGDSKTIQSVAATSTAGATVSLNGGGNVVYDPGALFNSLRAGQTATDSFTYTLVDGSGATSTATVTVTITGANDAPTAVADAVAATEDGVTTFLAATLLANDTDPDNGDSKAIQSVSATSTAGAAVSLNGAGNVVYNPGTLFNGLRAGQTATDTFTYTMVDGSGAISTATVTVTIGGTNDAPDAVNDSGFATQVNTALTIAQATLRANDTDPDIGDTLTITSVQGAVNGTVAISGGNVVFTPTAGYTGAASFTYTVTDGSGATDTATVSLTVQPAGGAGLTLRGTPNNDVLTGGAGNDLITGRGGDDRLTGNGGGDQFRFFGDEIIGPKDTDLITDLDFAQGDRLVFGAYQPGTFFDGPGVNAFTNDTAATISSWEGIVGATNASTRITGARSATNPDTFILILTNGAQTQEIEIAGGWARYVAAGGSEGVAGVTLRGSQGNDTLTGGAGGDFIIGRGGDDLLTGGFGADQFRFFATEITGAADTDRIADLTFAQGDVLVFGNFAAGTFSDAPGVNAFTGDTAATVSSWAGVVNLVDDSDLITARRETPGGDDLTLILTFGGQIQEIVIANGWAQYLAAGGTEGVI